MTKRMLIDTTHAEETRVVVLDGNRLEDYDVETVAKQQLKGNIYLAKIVRVEPSLQAAFVEFGGGRHGFLAFGEIHPDYYQIPVADRKRLLEAQEAEAREAEEEEEREVARERGRDRRRDRNGDARTAAAGEATDETTGATGDTTEGETAEGELAGSDEVEDAQEPAAADALTQAGYALQADPEAADEVAMPRPDQVAQAAAVHQDIMVAPEEAHALFADPVSDPTSDAEAAIALPAETATMDEDAPAAEPPADWDGDADRGTEAADHGADDAHHSQTGEDDAESGEVLAAPEQLGGENETDERPDRRTTPRFLRNYKIQEVMRRRQILLVQVVKEERGTKGAALTTYISLAGRFSVLMPNSPRGGGISRKITSAADRRRLKEVTSELDLPRGMGLIVRTAGANRPKPEITRDCEYLLDQWDQIRDLTMKSMAPALIYEEASLIKRAIRDVYSKDVDDILVDGEAGWRAARDFMRMLMPTHARKVQLWTDPQPLFAKAQVEAQLDSMLQPNVQLRSGGYLVINQTEALVAIDVNSGRSTRERGIEETALRTNMEAAEEAARQLRLRDLAGLIVIDFIDMESRRNNASVERKLKEALKNDRARIQVGSISHFGLLEMSRQRLRPSLTETNFVTCPHCGGSGHARSVESAALHVLRGIEEEGTKRRATEIVVHVAGAIALYILNHKRVRLAEIETRYGMQVTFAADDTLISPEMRVERVRTRAASELPMPVTPLAPPEPFEDPDEEVEAIEPEPVEDTPEDAAPAEPAAEGAEAAEAAEAADGEDRPKRRRRRRRGGRREDGTTADTEGAEAGDEPSQDASGDDAVEQVFEAGAEPVPSVATDTEVAPAADATAEATGEEGERKRRGRRGGRRRRRDAEPGAEGAPAEDAAGDDAPAPTSVPTPASTGPAYSAPTYSRPSYSGPTPADPFGGANAFDFFDAVEEAEQARVIQPTPSRMTEMPVSPAPDPVAEQAYTPVPSPSRSAALNSEAPVVDIPVTEMPVTETPVTEAPVAATPVAGTPAIGLVAGAEAAETADVAHVAPVTHESGVAPAPDPVAEQAFSDPVTTPPSTEAAPAGPATGPATGPASGPVIAPPIAPILIGGGETSTAEKKRGWWKR